MRNLIAAVFVAAASSGCGLELLTTTAIQGELQSQQATAMKRQLDNAAETSGQVNVQRAVDTFHAEKGVYPGSLDELVPGYLPSVPVQPNGTPYVYDAVSGRVTGGRPRNAVLGGPTAGDRHKMQQITQAINSYGHATGYYPPSLDALVPHYLGAVPKTDSGENFVFNPQTGAVSHPAQQAQNQAGHATTPAGGPGMMGETMTGIGMQQQLGNMSTAGSSSAGGHARDRTGRAMQMQQQQQEEALRQLGH